MRYKIEFFFFKKTEYLVKNAKIWFFEKTERLASTYKSDNLNCKLQKMTMYT